MKATKSILLIFSLIAYSNLIIGQNEESRATLKLKNDQKELSLNNNWFKTSSFKLGTLSKNSEVIPGLIARRPQTQLDKTLSKYLKSSNDNLRFNLNFVKADRYVYSSGDANNLNLMQIGYDKTYDPVIPESFVGTMFSDAVKSFLYNCVRSH